MRQSLRAAWVLMAISFRADPVRTVATVVLMTFTSAASAVFAFGLKILTDAAVAGDTRGVLVASAVIVVVLGALITTGWTGFHLQTILAEKAQVLIDQRLIEMVEDVPGIEHHERPDYHDEIELLRHERARLSKVLDAIVGNIGLVVQIGGTALLLAHLHPILLTLPLFALPSLWTSSIAERLRQRTLDECAEPIRATSHLFELATTPASGKELRVFGLGPHLLDRHNRGWDQVDSRISASARRSVMLSSAGWLFFSIGYAGAIFFVVRRAVLGQATPGDVLLALTVAAQINMQISGAVGMVMWVMASMKVARRYLWLADYAKEARAKLATAMGQPLPVPDVVREGIRFESVAFRYPGTETDVLSGVDLFVPAGTTIAVVGDNGAGKTTLVKLLCRFYEPTSGVITLDGINIQRFDPEEWRTRLSAGFQDFARFELLAGQTVGVGLLTQMDDEPAVVGALQRAGAEGVAPTLPTGLSTQLGRSFDGGVELSGGQWQKLALGRAMMREHPLLLVLDEPTASLDAETEHALFERYAQGARRIAETSGAITVLVSHRFSTVRMADLIVVVDGGRVVEAGSHRDLIEAQGLYAELYELQARGYR
ncbi:MAG TPA: ABC transporter ATP-binding protein [Actinomycetota bacterium]|nr:ABC transporter ATP-binding protein [Actinomycetota bacterium]